jgi:hypothetical protein|nr:MAG TPA: hypothetical protein [Caudoviricetes sp.]
MLKRVEILANIYEQIEAYENNILENIGAFIRRLTGLPVYLMDKPFIKPDTPYLTLRIVSSDDSNGWSQKFSYENDMFSYLMDNKYDIELLACKGRPVTLLTYVLAALRGADELKYQYLYSKGVSFLSATNVAQANTVLDGDKTEPRARIFLTFNTTMVIEDLSTTPIEHVNLNIHAFKTNYDDPTPLDFPLNFSSVGSLAGKTLYYTTLENGSLIKYIPHG